MSCLRVLPPYCITGGGCSRSLLETLTRIARSAGGNAGWRTHDVIGVLGAFSQNGTRYSSSVNSALRNSIVMRCVGSTTSTMCLTSCL